MRSNDFVKFEFRLFWEMRKSDLIDGYHDLFAPKKRYYFLFTSYFLPKWTCCIFEIDFQL